MQTELLARLGPGICRLDALGGGGHDFAALTPLDLAAGLAGAPYGGQLAVLAAYAGQLDVVPELCGRVRMAVWRLARAECWKAMTPRRADVLARLAVREFCAPPLCGGCEGRRIQWIPKPVNCEECGGSGSGRMAGSLVCEALGVGGEEWRGVWKWRYDRAFSLVAGWGSEALSHLARRLG